MPHIETGVLNPEPVDQSKLEANFKSFSFTYREAAAEKKGRQPRYQPDDYEQGYEIRRIDAAELALKGVWPTRLNYPSRVSLVAFWADDKQTALNRFYEIVETGNTVERYAGQTVVRFIQGTPTDLSVSEQRADDFSIEIGRIMPEGGLAHVLKVANDAQRPAGYDDTTFAHLSMVIPVMTDWQSLTCNSGRIEHAYRYIPDPKAKTKPRTMCLMPARSGLTSLSADTETYAATRRETSETLLFGDDEANDLVECLAMRDEPTYDRFQALVGKDGKLFDSQKPFPDLSMFVNQQPDPWDIDAVLAQNDAFMSSRR